ncbi:hypothetical protein [Nocardia sp. NPDC050435]|uniref:hypothetical protein n=1 Tax=Nocardia sp. NPDC050435 TaxID=3155040 RepID=UPI0033E3E0C3
MNVWAMLAAGKSRLRREEAEDASYTDTVASAKMDWEDAKAAVRAARTDPGLREDPAAMTVLEGAAWRASQVYTAAVCGILPGDQVDR